MEDYYIGQLILVGVLVLITGYYAFQTRRQANSLKQQLEAMAKQRRNSIKPFLQIDRIWPVLHRTAVTQFEPPLQLKNPKTNYIIFPSMQVDISNLGLGAAVRFNISANVVLEFMNEDTGESLLRKLNFNFPKQGKDQYIEPTKDKPRTLTLDFTPSDNEATNEAGKAECSLTYYDVDENFFTESRLYYLPSDTYKRQINKSETMPGDWDYPDNLLNI